MKLLSVHETEWVLHQLLCKGVQTLYTHTHLQSKIHSLFVPGHQLRLNTVDAPYSPEHAYAHANIPTQVNVGALTAKIGPRTGSYSGLNAPDPIRGRQMFTEMSDVSAEGARQANGACTILV